MENNEDKDFVEYRFNSNLNIETALKQAEESAWQHAKDYSMVNAVDLGSDEFTSVYLQLAERYQNNVDYLSFFMTTALLTIQALLDNNVIKLDPEGDRLTDDEVSDKIHQMADTLVNSYMWLLCGDRLTWMKNDELPETISYSFEFDPEEVIDLEEDNNGTE